MAESLAEALQKQIERISATRERLAKMAADCPEMASGMAITRFLIKHEIDRGRDAAASGDVTEMRAAHQRLAAIDTDTDTD